MTGPAGTAPARRSDLLVRNTLFNVASSLLLMAVAFFTTPYVVRKMGADAYGLYSMTFVVVGYFGFLELGLGRAVIRQVADCRARSDDAGLGETLGAAFVVYLVMGLVGAGALAALTDPLVVKAFRIPPALQETARFVFYVSALGFLVNMPCHVLGAVPRALQRFDVASAVDVVFGGAQSLAAVLLLHRGHTLRAVVVANVAVGALSFLAYLAVFHALLPGVRVRWRLRLATLRELFRFASVVALDNLLLLLSGRLNTFFLGVFRPISALTYYVIPEALCGRGGFLARGVSQAVFPALCQLQATPGQEGRLKELFLRSTKHLVVLTVPLLVVLVGLGDRLLLLWLGEPFVAESGTALKLLALAFVCSYWAAVSVEGARAVNHPELSAKVQMVLAVANVTLCLVLVPRQGVVGAALAWSVPRLVLIPLLIGAVATRLFGASPRELWACCFQRPLALGAVALLAAQAVSPAVGSLPGLVAVVALGLLAWAGLGYFLLLDGEERSVARRWLRPLVPQLGVGR